MNQNKIVYPDESYKIMGACFNVYKEIGSGFPEAVYQECLEIEFEYQKLSFIAQKQLKLSYREKILKKTFVPDFICYDKIIVEIKAVSKLTDGDKAQVFNYLKASKFKLGILVNFCHCPKLEYERIVL